MRNNSLFNLMIVIVLMPHVGCNSLNAPDCFQKAGSAKTVILTSDKPFNDVVIYDDIALNIVEDDTVYFELVYYENLIPEITFEYAKDSIILRNRNSCNFVRDFKRPLINYHTNKGTNNIYSLTAGNITNTDTLRNSVRIVCKDVSNLINLTVDNTLTIFSGNSSSNFNGQGKTQILRILAYFNDGKYDCSNLRAKRVDFLQRGYNDILVHVTDSLVGSIENAGRVFYTGDPGLKVNVENGGELIAR